MKKFLVIISIILLTACQQLKPLSSLANNFDKITIGTSKSAVTELIGEPEHRKSFKIAMVDAKLDIYHSYLTGQDYVVVYTLDRVVATAEF